MCVCVCVCVCMCVCVCVCVCVCWHVSSKAGVPVGTYYPTVHKYIVYIISLVSVHSVNIQSAIVHLYLMSSSLTAWYCTSTTVRGDMTQFLLSNCHQLLGGHTHTLLLSNYASFSLYTSISVIFSTWSTTLPHEHTFSVQP